MRKQILKTACSILLLSFILTLLVSCVRIKGTDAESVKEVYNYIGNEPEAFQIIKAIFPKSVDEAEIIESGVFFEEIFWDDYVLFIKCRYSPEEFENELERLKKVKVGPEPGLSGYVDEEQRSITWFNLFSKDGNSIIDYVMWFDDNTVAYISVKTVYSNVVLSTIPEAYRLPEVFDAEKDE